MPVQAKATAVAAVAALGLIAFAVAAQPESKARIAGAVYLGDLPTYVADERGLFAANGIEATVEYNPSGRINLARLRAGEVDFALMALTPIVLDRVADSNPGQPDDPVILASLLQSHELTAVIAAPGTGIDQPSDLAGRRVAIESGTNTEFVWWLFEQFHEINGPPAQTVSVEFPDMAEALISGQVEAAVVPEPWASQVEAGFLEQTGSPATRFDTRNLYAGRWVIVTTRRHANHLRRLCRNVLAAYRQAVEFIERSPAEAIAVYDRGARTGSSLLVERWQALDYDINLDWALVTGLQEQLRWARARSGSADSSAVSVLGLLATGPLEDAWPQSVNIPTSTALDADS